MAESLAEGEKGKSSLGLCQGPLLLEELAMDLCDWAPTLLGLLSPRVV